MTVILPNWQLGDLESLSLYRNFFHAATPRGYFGPLDPLVVIIPLIALILNWKSGGALRWMLGTTTVVGIIVLLMYLFYFAPKSAYLFSADTLDEALVAETVQAWIDGAVVRLILATIAFLASINAMRLFHRKSIQV